MNKLTKRALTGAVIVSIIVAASLYSQLTSGALWALVILGSFYELFKNKMGGALGVLYILVAGLSTYYIGFLNGTYDGMLIVSLFTAIWVNDSFAYLGGTAIGRKVFAQGLAPAISPNKSWEGTIIGAISSAAVGYLWYGAWGIILGLLVGLLATVSDLIQSRAKRKVGIKDSGSIFPGHGGVLDRFDSLGLTAPIVIIVVTIFRMI